MFYTVIASLPFLFVIIFLGPQVTSFFQLRLLGNFRTRRPVERGAMIIIISCFLVKFPIYLFHLWLPKAHVEAPVSGSIILAAVLLKLGGYGLIRLSPFIAPGLFVRIVQIIRLTGGAIVGLLCLLQKDLKVLIAYSSVSHIAIVVSGCLTKLRGVLAGGVALIIAHGLASSGLFAIANIAYERSHSRNFLLNMGALVVLPILSLF